ncbi:MAG TPA: hypothetical protein VNS63_17705 [Blastocatellia bacterium]|nr:hypothetical protein [Blastocatellia bacterium]
MPRLLTGVRFETKLQVLVEESNEGDQANAVWATEATEENPNG